MRMWMLALTCAVTCSGCMTTQLRNRMNDQASSIPDVYYQEVLNNLAMIHSSPSRMPYFSDPQTARTVIFQTANVSYGINWALITLAATARFFGRYRWDKQTASRTGGETASGEWAALTAKN